METVTLFQPSKEEYIYKKIDLSLQDFIDICRNNLDRWFKMHKDMSRNMYHKPPICYACKHAKQDRDCHNPDEIRKQVLFSIIGEIFGELDETGIRIPANGKGREEFIENCKKAILKHLERILEGTETEVFFRPHVFSPEDFI